MSKLEYRDIKQPNYRHVGKYTPRKDAKDIVTGKAIFLDDFSVPHMLYGKTKRSPYPHARILSIDTSRAEALPGVRAVITHKNMPEQWGLGLPVHRLLMEDKVYYVGDLVALIAADTVETAEEAIDLIDVEYEQLEAVYTAEDALKEGAVEIYSRFKGNHVDNGIKYFQPDGPWWQIIRGMWRRDLRKQPMWRKTRWPLTKCLRPWPRKPRPASPNMRAAMSIPYGHRPRAPIFLSSWAREGFPIPT